ncbi:phosphotransferase family protein [Nocardiopsis eucommiae]|uniref:phosphotransferase family protein n=1 Tax=Nocardiopsis eucommiae TaxID=2831970 RepID=UPI003D7494A9
MRALPPVGLLRELARRALGVRVVGVERLRGGTKKGVYRLVTADESSVVAYVWSAAENYWPASPAVEGPFSHADGVDLFVGAVEALEPLGVRTPRVLWVERDHRGLGGADVALVEDVRGPTLEEHIAHGDPVFVEGVLGRLGEVLAAMGTRWESGVGKVSRPLVRDRSGAELVVERALVDLAEGARRRPELAEVASAVEVRLGALFERVGPRFEHGLVHGELGPDHVLVDPSGEPVLIDVEGLMFFDAEWEHAFLRVRFGDLYRYLERPGLDPARTELYAWAEHLSLVAGPLRLLDGDFPDRAVLVGIAEHHLGRVLALTRE